MEAMGGKRKVSQIIRNILFLLKVILQPHYSPFEMLVLTSRLLCYLCKLLPILQTIVIHLFYIWFTAQIMVSYFHVLSSSNVLKCGQSSTTFLMFVTMINNVRRTTKFACLEKYLDMSGSFIGSFQVETILCAPTQNK